MSASLVNGGGVGADFDDVKQEVAIAHPRQLVFLICLREARHVVGLFRLDADDVALGGGGQRSLGEKVGPVFCFGRGAGNSGDEAFGAEGFFVEEVRGLQAFVDGAVGALGFERGRIDSQLGKKSGGLGAIGERGLDGDGASVGEEETASGAEFVAFGMASEVVVIVENQNAGFGSGLFAVKVRGSETADATTDYDEIVFLSGVDCGGGTVVRVVADGVSGFERAGMAAAHSGEGWRVVSRAVLGRDVGLGGAKEVRHPSTD